MIPQETIRQIIDTARIDEVVGDYVSLKKRGTNLLGLCPFHQEKTPSFVVSPAKGLFKCFGCGKGGDALTFVMEHEHYTYPEALKYLAKKYQIEIKEEERTPEQIEKLNERESLFTLSDFSAKYFSKILWENPQGRAIGLSYFRERMFPDPIIEKFQLGYCLDEWDAFTKEALKQAYPKKALAETGLSIEKDDKLFDRFRGRVMFPIHNLSGRVIGFGGRILGSDKTKAKYVNSPESEIYNKSQVLYGIYFAKKTILQKDLCYLVEGYTDVISLHQAGVENVVASSGTSLTQDQIKLISRFTRNITILYDGDTAGIKASFRGIDMILAQGLNVKVVLFPNGEDPDSYARKHSSSEVEDYVGSHAVDFIRFKADVLLEDAKDDPIKRANLINDILQSISLIPDNIVRSVYIQECSRIVQIPEADLMMRLNKILRTQSHNPVKEEKQISQASKNEDNSSIVKYEQEKEILRILLNYGSLETCQNILEDGENIEKKLGVAEYIVQEIENDEIQFSHLLYAEIYDLFKQAMGTPLTERVIPTITSFSGYSPQVREIIAETSIHQYELSPIWAEKGIYVIKEEEPKRLDALVFERLLEFKIRKVEDMMRDNKVLLAVCQNEEEADRLLRIKKQLDEIRSRFSRKLRRVIVRK